jgi:hypothetical protein
MSHSGNQRELESRVIRAAETALSNQQYVSAIDVLCGMGLLHAAQVDLWRNGRVDFLEHVIQGNLSKISSSMAIFHRWAREKGLKPSETIRYEAATLGGGRYHPQGRKQVLRTLSRFAHMDPA